MEKNPTTTPPRELLDSDHGQSALSDPLSFFSPFLSFRYTSRTIFSDEQKTHVRAAEHRFENGRFESKTFEGTLAPGVYDDMVRQMHRWFSAQMVLFLAPFSFLLPDTTRKKGE